MTGLESGNDGGEIGDADRRAAIPHFFALFALFAPLRQIQNSARQHAFADEQLFRLFERHVRFGED